MGGFKSAIDSLMGSNRYVQNPTTCLAMTLFAQIGAAGTLWVCESCPTTVVRAAL